MKTKLLFCLILFSCFANGQYKVLYNFDGTKGSQPYNSLIISGSTMYATASEGGAFNYGVVFSYNMADSVYKDLFDFNDTIGAFPECTLTLAGNTLYGVGAHLFSIDTNGSNFRQLSYSVSSAGSFLLSGALLYGMNYALGRHGQGNVFSIDTNGNNYHDLFDFDDTNGAYPYGNVIISGSELYGMTTENYVADGNIFKIDTNGGGFKNLLNFADTNGMNPMGSLVVSGNKLYGMTQRGGLHSVGIIFSIDTNGNGFKDLYDFYDTNGTLPYGSLIIAGSKLYGMAYFGGKYGYGDIFSIDTDGSDFTRLFDFNHSDGANPLGSLTLLGHTIYGMTSLGGTNNGGVIFSFKDTAIVNSVNTVAAKPAIVSIYPNPTTGITTIQISNNEQGTKNLEVYNVLGEKVYSQFSINNSQFSIDLRSKSNGVYLYKITDESGKVIKADKIVVER